MSQPLTVSPPSPHLGRTQQRLREAFLALVLQDGFEQVRVGDIIARAGVNRATFYRHYHNKRDLLKSWTQEVGQLLEAQADSLSDPRILEGDASHLPDVVVMVFGHIQQHAPYYRLMIGRHGLSSIASELERQVTQFIGARTLLFFGEAPEQGVPVGMLTRAYAAQFVGVVQWWLEQDLQPDARQVAQWHWALVLSNPATGAAP
jgi:AcrR family transcriptional regulator